MTKQQKLICFAALAVVLIAVGWTLLPFRFANAVDCGPPLLGAKPGSYESKGVGLIKPDRDCHDKAKSRLTVAAVASLLAVGTAAAALHFQPLSRQCMSGSHDECPEWWPAALGVGGESFSCQCPCHRT